MPALPKLLSIRADVPPVQPPKPPCCLLLSAALCPGAPQRGNTRHHRETGSGTGCQDGAYAASDKFPARGLCPAHTVSSEESGADESHCASRSCRLYVVLTLGSTTGSTIRRPRPRSGAPQPPLSAAALPKVRKEWPAALHLRFVPACPFHRRSHGGLPVCFLFRCSGQCPGTVLRQTGPGHGQPCSSFWSLHADSSFCLCRPGRAPESFPEDLRALPSGRLRLEAFPPGSLRSFRYFRKPFSRMRAKSSAGMGLA